MKPLLICLSLALMSVNALSAQTSDYDVLKDEQNGSTVFKGEFNFEDLIAEPTFSWMQRGALAYKPDTAALKYLQKNLRGYEVVILLGTWCEDSQNLIPKLYKTLMASDYPLSRIKMYGVDRAKTTKYVESKLYKVEKVPTIILYKEHKEIGRIVETVKKSIEVDLAQIIRKSLPETAR